MQDHPKVASWAIHVNKRLSGNVLMQEIADLDVLNKGIFRGSAELASNYIDVERKF
jgi:hypothetical protein